MTENRQSQQKRILSALEERGSITSEECQSLLGIVDGRKRISELRRLGFGIGDRWETGLNRYGSQCRYKRYFLMEVSA